MNADKMHTLLIPQGDLKVIAAALQELPFKVAAPVLTRIQAQIDAAKGEKTAAPKPEDSERKETTIP